MNQDNHPSVLSVFYIYLNVRLKRHCVDNFSVKLSDHERVTLEIIVICYDSQRRLSLKGAVKEITYGCIVC